MNRLLKISSITGSTVRAERARRRARHVRAQQQVVARRDLGAPARLDDGRGVGIGDDRRAVDALRHGQRFTAEERRVVPSPPAYIRTRPPARPAGALRRRRVSRAGAARSPARSPRPTPTRSPARARASGTRSARGTRARTRRASRARRRAATAQRGIGAVVLEVHAARDLDALAAACPAPAPRRARPAPSASSSARTSGSACRSSARSNARSRIAVMSARPMPSADSTPASGWMNTRRMPSSSATRHACCPPAPPKHASVYAVTSCPRCTEINLIAFAMFATAIAQKAFRDLLGAASLAGCGADLARQRREARAHHVAVERLIGAAAEHAAGKNARLDPAEHHVAVRHRERPAAAIAGRPRVGAGGIRTDAKALAVEVQDRPAAGGDGVNRSSSARACARRRPGVSNYARSRSSAGEVRHVGRRAAHVEADHACRSPRPARVRTMPTMPPAGPDRIESLPWNVAASVRPPFDCMN